MTDGSELFPPGTRVAALPTWRAPRLFVAGGARWRTSALYPASRPLARLARLVARAAFSAGLAPTRTARGPGAPGGRFGRAVAVLPGTAGPTRKTTVALADEHGTIAAFAKIATLPAARARLRHEHALLAHLATRGLGAAPAPLDLDDGPERTVLVVRAVAGHPVSWTTPPAAALRAAVGHLHHGPERPAAAHPWLVAAATEAGAAWLEALGSRTWPAALRHGDLTGAHVLAAGDGAVALVDWEYGAAEGFPWVDLAHFVLQAEALVRRSPPARGRARAVAALTGWPALGAAEADAIVRLAAFAALRDGRADGHGDDTPLQAWRRAVWSG